MPRRRLVETLIVVAALLAVLAPLILGPALSPLARALGGDGEHACACGMAPGRCGCPECARLEHQRLRERAPAPYPVLRSQCEGNDLAVGSPPLPLALPVALPLVVAQATSTVSAPSPSPRTRSRGAPEPTTPPPRSGDTTNESSETFGS